MKTIDMILIALVVVIMVIIFYFSIWRHRKDPCHGCPYAKNCGDNEDKNCNKKNK